MKLPAEFSFNQQNLQDYLDCPRRFELRYLQQLAWPAIRSEPALELERHLRLGERFHQMIQQHLLGLPPEAVASQATEVELDEWWRNYLNHPPTSLPGQHYPEITLVAPFEGCRLVAKYDLLAIEPDRSAVIVDWKTNRRATIPATLKARAQSRLYPFLLIIAGAQLNSGAPLLPEQVEMIYWFTADPVHPISFDYSQSQFQADREFFQEIIDKIEVQEPPFLLTTDNKRCLYCNYRSLCQRGIAAGVDAEGVTEADREEPLLPELDFDQVAEIEF